MFGKMTIEELNGIPCEVEIASEFYYRLVVDYCQNLAMVAIFQSYPTRTIVRVGYEMADTPAVFKKFKKITHQYHHLNRRGCL